MIAGGWFALHRREGYEDTLIQLDANFMFILGRKVQAFRKHAASMPASDIGGQGFSVNFGGSSAKLLPR